MTQYDIKLKELHAQMMRMDKVNAMLEELYSKQGVLGRREAELRAQRDKEQQDVDKLEGGSLASLVYAILGRKEEQLEKERREAMEAAVRHDTVLRQLNAAKLDISHLVNERSKLYESAAEYRRVLKEKQDYLLEKDPVNGPKLCELEEKLGAIANQRREVEEAVTAGNAVLRQISTVMGELDSAEGWGTLDIFGGGLISDIAKYSHLDDAQNAISYLQVLLDRFRNEMTDVRYVGDIQVKPGEFLTFADFFFDNLFTDWAVLDHIHQTQSCIRDVEQRVSQLLYQLENMAADLTKQEEATHKEMDELVVSA